MRAHELARGDHSRRALRKTRRRAVFEPFRPPTRSSPRERVQASQVVKVCRKEHVARADVLEVRGEILRAAAGGLRRDERRVDSLSRIGRDGADEVSERGRTKRRGAE